MMLLVLCLRLEKVSKIKKIAVTVFLLSTVSVVTIAKNRICNVLLQK